MSDNANGELIDAVKRYLERTGTTKQALARQLDCHRATLYRYLTGDSTIPEAVKRRFMEIVTSDSSLLDDEKQQLTALAGEERQQLTPYLDWIEQEYGSTELLGIADEQVQLDLQQVYVPLRVVSRNEFEDYRRKMRGESPQGGAVGNREGKSVFALLSDPPGDDQPVTTRRLLLLGEAGSGKTMTLRYGTLRLAVAYRANDPDQLANPTTHKELARLPVKWIANNRIQSRTIGLHLRLPQVPLPIYVRLTLFAATLPEDAGQWSSVSPDDFLTWIDQQAVRDCSGLQEGVLSELIRRNDSGVMLLLDGLDEAGERQRSYLARVISQLAYCYENQRYLVASRTAGYGGEVALPGFLERHLSPLNAKEAQKLLANWFRDVDGRMRLPIRWRNSGMRSYAVSNSVRSRQTHSY